MSIQSITNSGSVAYPTKESLAAQVAKPAAVASPPVDITRTGSSASETAADAGAVKEALEKINTSIQGFVSHLEFSIDSDTNRNIVKVVDNRTKDVIRQFPSEEVLNIAKALDNFKGLLLKESA